MLAKAALFALSLSGCATNFANPPPPWNGRLEWRESGSPLRPATLYRQARNAALRHARCLAWASTALISACAAPLPNQPNVWQGTVNWTISKHPDVLCALALPPKRHLSRGCHWIDRDGVHRIVTGPIRSRRDLETVGHELTHAAFGAFHPVDTPLTDEMLNR